MNARCGERERSGATNERAAPGGASAPAKLAVALIRRSPPENCHRNVVRAVKVSPHLLLKVIHRIESQIIVEPLLIISVAALDLAVVPRRFRDDQFVPYPIPFAENIKRMDSFRAFVMGEFRSVIGLDDIRRIAEIGDRPFYKVNRRIAALLAISIYEPLSGSFLDDRVLIKLLLIFAGITGSRHIFYVHLPFLSDFRRRVVFAVMFGFLFGGFDFLSESQSDEYAIQRAGMTGIGFFLAELAVQFTNGDVRGSSVIVNDPFQFFFRVCVRMRRFRAVRAVLEGFPRAVIAFVPAHQRGFGNMVFSANVVNIFVDSVQFYRLEFGYYLVWTISLVCAIILHRVIESFLI